MPDKTITPPETLFSVWRASVDERLDSNEEAIEAKQPKLTAGENITIDENNVISASIEVTDETDPVFTASVAYGITAEDIANWNAKSDFSGNYEDLNDLPESLSQFNNDIIYGENDGTYWTSLTIDGSTYDLPQGSGSDVVDHLLVRSNDSYYPYIGLFNDRITYV